MDKHKDCDCDTCNNLLRTIHEHFQPLLQLLKDQQSRCKFLRYKYRNVAHTESKDDYTTEEKTWSALIASMEQYDIDKNNDN